MIKKKMSNNYPLLKGFLSLLLLVVFALSNCCIDTATAGTASAAAAAAVNVDVDEKSSGLDNGNDENDINSVVATLNDAIIDQSQTQKQILGPKVAVIGCGPGGMFFLKHLEKERNKLNMEMKDAASALLIADKDEVIINKKSIEIAKIRKKIDALPRVTVFEHEDRCGGLWQSKLQQQQQNQEQKDNNNNKIDSKAASGDDDAEEEEYDYDGEDYYDYYDEDEEEETTITSSDDAETLDEYEKEVKKHSYGEGMYDGMWINSPKEIFEFEDYTFDEHFKGKVMPSFLTRSQVLSYIEGRTNDVIQYHTSKGNIRFNTEVVWIDTYEEDAVIETDETDNDDSSSSNTGDIAVGDAPTCSSEDDTKESNNDDKNNSSNKSRRKIKKKRNNKCKLKFTIETKQKPSSTMSNGRGGKVNNLTTNTTYDGFDKIVMATGVDDEPIIPYSTNEKLKKYPIKFDGPILHSSQINQLGLKWNNLTEKRILFIGSSYSAEDLALSLIKRGAEHIFITTRKSLSFWSPITHTKSWPMDKVSILYQTEIDEVVNTDENGTIRASHLVTNHSISTGNSFIMGPTVADYTDENAYGEAVTAAATTKVTRRLHDYVRDEKKHVPDATRDGGTVFKDGYFLLRDIDAIIYCTGYDLKETILPESLQTVNETKELDLYGIEDCDYDYCYYPADTTSSSSSDGSSGDDDDDDDDYDDSVRRTPMGLKGMFSDLSSSSSSTSSSWPNMYGSEYGTMPTEMKKNACGCYPTNPKYDTSKMEPLDANPEVNNARIHNLYNRHLITNPSMFYLVGGELDIPLLELDINAALILRVILNETNKELIEIEEASNDIDSSSSRKSARKKKKKALMESDDDTDVDGDVQMMLKKLSYRVFHDVRNSRWLRESYDMDYDANQAVAESLFLDYHNDTEEHNAVCSYPKINSYTSGYSILKLALEAKKADHPAQYFIEKVDVEEKEDESSSSCPSFVYADYTEGYVPKTYWKLSERGMKLHELMTADFMSRLLVRQGTNETFRDVHTDAYRSIYTGTKSRKFTKLWLDINDDLAEEERKNR